MYSGFISTLNFLENYSWKCFFIWFQYIIGLTPISQKNIFTLYYNPISRFSLSTPNIQLFDLTFQPHYDYSRREKDLYNNRRIATWLSYLTTVEQGGGTVFTTAGIHVRSISGSAVFWYNLLPNGSGDIRTRHAACPVLKGNKWVSNKWIHEFGNEFQRSCGLDEELENFLDLP